MLSILLLLQLSTPTFASIHPSQPGEGRGTIGIVCVDPDNGVHFWNSRARAANAAPDDRRTDFETCLDQVVQTAVSKGAQRDYPEFSGDGGGDNLIDSTSEWIGGFKTLKKKVETRNQSSFR